MSETLDDGLDFGGYPQPPDVPPDPTGDDWRGPPGPQGPPGVGGGPFPTTEPPAGSGIIWNNGGVLCVA